MYLHTGNGRIVSHRDLIGIFDYKLFAGTGIKKGKLPVAACLPPAWAKEGKSRFKSIIVTDSETFAAPISPQTLAGRSTLRQIGHLKS